MKFSDTLKDLRKERGETQATSAKQIGVSQSVFCDWENGKVEPTLSAIIAISKYFNVNADYLLGLTDEWGNAQPSSGSSSTGTTKPPSELSEDERNILQQYKTLSPQRKREVAVWIQTLNEIDNQTTNLNKNRKTS